MNNGTDKATSEMLPPLLSTLADPSTAVGAISTENGAEKYSKVLHKQIDDATQVIVGSLDDLIKEIEKMKTKVISTGGAAKAGITSHFSLGNEAAKFTVEIHEKLKGYIAEAEAAMKV